jgi:outer membrane receptor protein involved in Fe transport
LRFDEVNEFTNENQVSPRVNAVWKATESTTVHAGYSRYFVPPPFELVAPTAIAHFNNTTAAPRVQQDDIVKAERSHYFDVVISQIVTPGLTVGFDGYYKLATNLIDEGQFGAPIILSAFNYARAHVAGAEFTLSYDQGRGRSMAMPPIRALWAPTSSRHSSTLGQTNWLTPRNITFISTMIRHGPRRREQPTRSTRVRIPNPRSVDLLAQSGLRASTPTVPNGASLPEYAAVNASIVQKLDLGLGQGTELRLDVLNIGDAVYEIRNGTGVGVGAPRFGIRRTILAGLTQRF